MLVPCLYLLSVSNTAYLNTQAALTYKNLTKLKKQRINNSTHSQVSQWVYEFFSEKIAIFKTYEHVSEIDIIHSIWFCPFCVNVIFRSLTYLNSLLNLGICFK